MHKTDDTVPRCLCGHLWWSHKYKNLRCLFCMNFTRLSLDGTGVEKDTPYIKGEFCNGFKWAKKENVK